MINKFENIVQTREVAGVSVLLWEDEIVDETLRSNEVNLPIILFFLEIESSFDEEVGSFREIEFSEKFVGVGIHEDQLEEVEAGYDGGEAPKEEFVGENTGFFFCEVGFVVGYFFGKVV